jgi:predicted PurR-regulated permease PerM
MPTELIVLIAALIVAWLVFQALLKVLKTTLSTAIAVFVIVIILGIFGISSEDLIREITNLPQTLMRLFTNTQSQIGI